jgi:sulfonate transport system ATP-binding protein
VNAAINPVNDLRIQGVSKVFQIEDRTVEALQSIDLTVKAGEFVSIVGGSGCGKSTLLRLVAGLETPTVGSLSIGGRAITGTGLDRGMVFQESRLFPWQTVEENIAFGITGNLSRTGIHKVVKEHIELVGLSGFEKALPYQLSGGMQQRVSIARALVNRPEILLLDEPFGALDALTRIEMQEEVLRIWRSEGATMILVTHDIDEALFLGDRVVVMSPRPGRIKKILNVDLPRPRDRNDPGFNYLRREIYSEFFATSEKTIEYQI